MVVRVDVRTDEGEIGELLGTVVCDPRRWPFRARVAALDFWLGWCQAWPERKETLDG